MSALISPSDPFHKVFSYFPDDPELCNAITAGVSKKESSQVTEVDALTGLNEGFWAENLLRYVKDHTETESGDHSLVSRYIDAIRKLQSRPTEASAPSDPIWYRLGNTLKTALEKTADLPKKEALLSKVNELFKTTNKRVVVDAESSAKKAKTADNTVEKQTVEKQEEQVSPPMSEAEAKAFFSNMMKTIADASKEYSITLPIDLSTIENLLTADPEQLEKASLDQIATELHNAASKKREVSLETIKEKVCQALKSKNVTAAVLLETATKELTGSIDHWNKVLYDFKLTNGGYMSATRQLMGDPIPQLAAFVADKLDLRIESL